MCLEVLRPVWKWSKERKFDISRQNLQSWLWFSYRPGFECCNYVK